MPVFDICVSAHVTVLESFELPITAETEEEAIQKARKAFRKELENRYRWCDYDEINLDYVGKICD